MTTIFLQSTENDLGCTLSIIQAADGSNGDTVTWPQGVTPTGAQTTAANNRLAVYRKAFNLQQELPQVPLLAACLVYLAAEINATTPPAWATRAINRAAAVITG